MSAWPGTLPQVPLQDGYAEQPGDNILRTRMDVGPDKRRMRGTVAPRTIQFKMYITNALIPTLDTFYISTTHFGADSFTFPVPVTGTVSVHFKQPPTRIAFGADWMCSFVIEVDP